MNQAALLDPPATTAVTSENHAPLSFCEDQFRRSFNQEPFLIGHSLSDHPLFEMPRLLELARRLPENHVEYNAGKLPLTVDQSLTPRNGLSIEETVRRIEECQSWMVIKWVHHDPEYNTLLTACLDQIRPLTEQIVPGMRQPQAYIFLTSPGSVTPYHIDPEHNFLLQIRGSKTIRQFNGRDPNVLSPRELETFYGGQSRNLVFRDELHDQGWTFDLHPGQGLHFPVTFPHYVQNGPEVSVSFSITFRTPDLERRRMIHQCNWFLRRRGLQPRPVGERPWCDQLKYQSVRVWTRLNELLHGRD